MSFLFNSPIKVVLFLFAPIFLLMIGSNGFFLCNIFLLGTTFVLFLFFLLFSFTSLVEVVNINHLILFFLFACSLITFLFFTDSKSISKPVLSLIYFIIFYFFSVTSLKSSPFEQNFSIHLIKMVYIIFGFTLFIYLIDVITGGAFKNEEGRFYGWSQSPTTFSTYLLWLYITYLIFKHDDKIVKRIFVFFVFFVIVWATGTRSTILVLFLIFISSFSFINNFFSKFFFLSIFSFVMLFLALEFVSELLETTGLLNLFGRYEGKQDDSAITRIALTAKMIQVISNSDILTLLFGNGFEFSFNLFNNENVEKHQLVVLPHNDFLKVLIDQGVVFLVVFLGLLLRLFKRISFMGIAPIFLYFSSFFHNMVYDHFNIMLLFLIYNLMKISDKSNNINSK